MGAYERNSLAGPQSEGALEVRTFLFKDRAVGSGRPPQPARRLEREQATSRSSGDTYHITINGNVDQALLPTSLAAAAAREDSLDPEAALQQLSQTLAKARVKAGKPLLKTLARELVYSESMLSRVFNGKLVPARDKLEALAEHFDVDTRTFTTIWVPLWEAATRKPADRKPKTDAAPEPPAGPTSPPEALGDFACPSCKAQVLLVNAPGHIEWHMSLGSAQFPTASVTHLRSVE